MSKIILLITLLFLSIMGKGGTIGDNVRFNNREAKLASDTSKERVLTRRERSDDPGPLEVVVSRLTQDVSALTAKLQAAENTIGSQRSEFLNLLDSKGSTYVRWGRSQCPNGSQLLYSGFAGGSDVDDTGSGSNRLCLSPEPVFDDTTILGAVGTLSGAQYYFSGYRYTDVLCAVCYTPLSATFMVPGTNRCPSSTTQQYNGYLTAEEAKQEAQADYVCMDAQPEDHPGSAANQHPTGFFEHVVTVCRGSLTCPPFVDHKVVTCAVCSK